MSHGVSRSEYTQRTRDKSLREREVKKIGEYNELVARTQELRAAGECSLTALQRTSEVLKMNPEFYTMWNYRRHILLNMTLVKFIPPKEEDSTAEQQPSNGEEVQQDPAEVIKSLAAAHDSKISLHLKEELAFLVPLLTSYPKCYWIWNHRLWVLQQSSLLASPEKAASLWRAELDLVGMMLRRDSRNFHGWMYRRIVVGSIEHAEQAQQTSLVKDEFAYTTKILQGVGGLANYSAWHRRVTLIPRLLEEKGASSQERMDFLEDELELLKRTMTTDPEDQSLWFYHRWLVYSNASPSLSSDKVSMIAPGMGRSIRLMMVSEEVEWLKDLLDSHPECKYILKALVTYTELLQQIRKETPNENEEGEEEEEPDEDSEKQVMRKWLERLISIDPMRKGRYLDLGKSFAS